jgi:hypothetical protein
LKKFVLLFCLFGGCAPLLAQHSSIATDVSLLRSFTKGSAFWAIGQTVQAHYHFAPKTSGYASISYYTNGSFKNGLTAFAVDSLVSPQQLNYTVSSY